MNLKLALIAGGALFATPALAQDDPPAGGTVEAGAGAEVSTDPAVTTDPAATATVDTGVGMSWSRILIERPYVRPAGKISAYGALGITRFSFFEPVTMTTFSGTGDVFGVGGAYGVTDQITAGAQYAFVPGLFDAESSIEGQLDLFGGFQLVHSSKMSITASADFGVNLSGDETSMAIHAGLGARYNLGPKMALFTGAPYGPGPVGQHLTISLDDGNAMSFDVPIGFMYQAGMELNIHVATSLAHIAFNDAAGDTIVFGADYIPLSIGALYSVNPNIDVVGSFSLFDLKSDARFDILQFMVGARYHN